MSACARNSSSAGTRTVRPQLQEAEEPDEDREGSGNISLLSPRRIRGLRGKHADFLAEGRDLQREMRQLAARFLGRTAGNSSQGSEPTTAAKGNGKPDLESIRRRLERFREELEQHRQEEIDLVLESVTTDIGGGD